jgi:hypothetical protein
MDNIVFIPMLGSILAMTAAFIWVAIKVGGSQKKKPAEDPNTLAAEKDVEHIFNE